MAAEKERNKTRTSSPSDYLDTATQPPPGFLRFRSIPKLEPTRLRIASSGKGGVWTGKNGQGYEKATFHRRSPCTTSYLPHGSLAEVKVKRSARTSFNGYGQVPWTRGMDLYDQNMVEADDFVAIFRHGFALSSLGPQNQSTTRNG
jgi:hypothetical protein